MRRVAALEKARKAAKRPVLSNSTIDGGAVQATDDYGTLTMVVGKQFDGTSTTAVVTGPTPPTPTVPLVTSQIGALRVYWDGTFSGSEPVPMDFSRVLIYAVPLAQFVSAEPTNQSIIVGQISSATGGEITAGLDPDVEYAVYLVAWSQAGKYSAASDVATGTPIAGQASAAGDGSMIYYSQTMPPGTDYKVNDTWFDEAHGNAINQWDGTAWVPQVLGGDALAPGSVSEIQLADTISTAISDANTAAANAQAAADQASSDLVAGDQSTLTAAQTYTDTSVSKRNSVFVQTATPTALAVNDTWVDTGNGNAIKTWDGSNWVARPLDAVNLVAGSVTASQLAAGSVIAGKVAANAIVASNIQGTQIDASKMVAGTITAASGIIANAAIGTAQIIDGSISSAKIADAQITTAKIADAAITSAKIGTLDASKITTGTLSGVTISGVTITGSTVRNSDTIPRLELSPATSSVLDVNSGQTVNAQTLTAYLANGHTAILDAYQMVIGTTPIDLIELRTRETAAWTNVFAASTASGISAYNANYNGAVSYVSAGTDGTLGLWTQFGTSVHGNFNHNPGHEIVSKSASQSIATAAYTTVSWQNEDSYYGGCWARDVYGVWTCLRPGLYRISFGIDFAANTTGSRAVRIIQNGAMVRRWLGTAASVAIQIAGSCVLDMAANDTFYLQAYQSSGAALSIIADTNHGTFLEIVRLGNSNPL